MSEQGNNTAIGGGGFHHVAMKANDFDATLAFYTEGLGFRRTYGWGSDDRPGGGVDSRAALLDTGNGSYLEVFGGGKGADEPAPEGVVLHFALRTSNADEALERARAAGAVVTVEPKTVCVQGDRALDFRIAFVRGLNGEIIEFFQNDEL